MEFQEQRDAIIKNVRWESERPPVTGGQKCGLPNYPVILISDECDIKITVGHFKSNIKTMQENPKPKFLLIAALIMWISISTFIQRVKCPKMTETELFLRIPQSFLANWQLCN
jgi:hypothetical protein